MIKVVKLNSLFWDNGSREKPDAVPDFREWTELKEEVVWTNIKISGWIILKGDWNYGYTEGQYVFLKRQSIADRESNTWNYVVIKDFWVNWLVNKVIVNGYCKRTNNEELILNNIDYVTPSLSNPVRQVKLNLTEDVNKYWWSELQIRIPQLTEAEFVKTSYNELAWYKFIKGIEATPLMNEGEIDDDVGVTIISKLEPVAEPDTWKLRLFNIVKENFLRKSKVIENYDLGKLTDRLGDTFSRKGKFALNLKTESYSDFVESAKVTQLDFSNLRDIKEIDVNTGERKAQTEFKFNQFIPSNLKIVNDSLLTEEDRERFKEYYSLQRKVYLPYTDKIKLLGDSNLKPKIYDSFAQIVSSKKYPTEKLFLPFINQLDSNLQEKDGSLVTGKFEDLLSFQNEFGFLLFNYVKDYRYWNWWHFTGGNQDLESEIQTSLPVLVGLKEGWNKPTLTTYLEDVKDWADEVSKIWNNFDLFASLSPYSFLSYLTILKDDNLVHNQKDWKLNSRIALENLLFKKDNNKITEQYISNAYLQFFSQYGIFDEIDVEEVAYPIERGDIFFNNLRAGWALETEVTNDAGKVNRLNHLKNTPQTEFEFPRETLIAYWNNNTKKYELGIYTQYVIEHSLDENQDIQKVITSSPDINLDSNYETLGTNYQKVTYNHIRPIKRYNSLNGPKKKEWRKEKFKIWAETEEGKAVLKDIDEWTKEAYAKGYQATNEIDRGWLGPKWEEKFTENFKKDFGLKGSFLTQLPKTSDGSYDLDKLFQMFDVKDKFEVKENRPKKEYKDASFIYKGESENTPIPEKWLDPSWWQTETFDEIATGGMAGLFATGKALLWGSYGATAYGYGKKYAGSILSQHIKGGNIRRGYKMLKAQQASRITWNIKSRIGREIFSNRVTPYTTRNLVQWGKVKRSWRAGLDALRYKNNINSAIVKSFLKLKVSHTSVTKKLFERKLATTARYVGSKFSIGRGIATGLGKALSRASYLGWGAWLTKKLLPFEYIHKGNENEKTRELRKQNLIIKFGDGSWIWGSTAGVTNGEDSSPELNQPLSILHHIQEFVYPLLEIDDFGEFGNIDADNVSGLIASLNIENNQKDIARELNIDSLITQPSLQPFEIKGKLFDLVGTNYELYIDIKGNPTLIFKDTEHLKLYEEKVYRLSNEVIPSQDLIDIVNQQTSLQVLTTELPLEERFIFEKQIAPPSYTTRGEEFDYVYEDDFEDLLEDDINPEGFENIKFYSGVDEGEREWNISTDFRVVIEQLANESKNSAYDYYIVSYQGARQLLDVKLSVPKKEFSLKKTTDTLLLEDLKLRQALHFERYGLDKEKIRFTEDYQQKRLGFEQEALQNKEIDAYVNGVVGLTAGVLGTIGGTAVGAFAGGPSGAGLALAGGIRSIYKTGFGLGTGLRDIELEGRELASKKEFIEAKYLNASLTLNTLHKYQEKEFQLKFLQQGNTYSVGSFNDRDVIDAYNDSRGLNSVHLIYRYPSHRQKEALRRYYELYGVECNIPDVTIKLEELKEGDIYVFDLIENLENIWAVEEIEYLKNVLRNGIKVLELKDNKPLLIPEVPLSWAQRVGNLLNEASEEEKDILLNKLAVGPRAEELVKRLAETFVDKNKLAELILPFLNKPALIAQALEDKNLDEKTDLILRALDGIDTDEVFKYLLDERDKAELLGEWLENPEDERDLVTVFFNKYKETLIHKDTHKNIVDEHKTTIKRYEDEVRDLHTDLGKLQKELGECNEALDSKKKELTRTEEDLRKTKKQKSVLLAEIGSLRADKDENNREISNLKKDLKDLGNKIKDLKDLKAKQEGDILDKDREILAKKQQISSLEDELGKTKVKLENKEKEFDQIKKDFVELNKSVDDQAKYIDTINKAYSKVEKERDETNEELKKLAEANQNLIKEKATEEDAKIKALEENKTLTKQYDKKLIEAKKCKEKLDDLEKGIEVDGERYDKEKVRVLIQKKNDAERDEENCKKLKDWVDKKGGLDEIERKLENIEEQEKFIGTQKKQIDDLTNKLKAKKVIDQWQGAGKAVIKGLRQKSSILDNHNVDYLVVKRKDDKLAITVWNDEKKIWQEQPDLVIKRRDETKLLRIANKVEKFVTDQYPLWSYYRNQHGSKYNITVSTFSVLDNYLNDTNIKNAHAWVGRYSVEVDKNIPWLDKDGNWIKSYWYHKTKGWFDYDIGDGATEVKSYEEYIKLEKDAVADLRKELEETKKSLKAVREIEEQKTKLLAKANVRDFRWVTRMYNRFTTWQTNDVSGNTRVYYDGSWRGERQLQEQPAVVMKNYDGNFRILIPVYFGLCPKGTYENRANVYWIPFYYNISGSDAIKYGRYSGSGNLIKYDNDNRKRGYVPDYYSGYIENTATTWEQIRTHILDVGGSNLENAKKNPVSIDALYEYRFTNQYLPFLSASDGQSISAKLYNEGDMSWNKTFSNSSTIIFNINKMQFEYRGSDIIVTPIKGQAIHRIKDMQDYIVCMLGFDIWNGNDITTYFIKKYNPTALDEN